jgi:hypothetical protein
MPFGELVTSLRADLVQYERDLNAAYAKAEAWSKRMQGLQAKLVSPAIGGMGGAGGGGAAGSIDANFRRMEAARQAAEREARNLAAARVAAEREQRQMSASQAAAERDNARLGTETMRAKMADLKQQLLLKRELERQDVESAKQEAKLSQEGMRAKNADVKQQILLQREIDRQNKEEQKEVDRNLKEVERRRVQMLREDAQSKQNDVKQQMVFRRELDRQDEVSAKAARQAAKEEMAAKNADVKQQMVLRRELDRQDRESEKAKQQAAREELAAKNANVKQQILLQRELDRQDKEEANKTRQQQRDEIRIAGVTRVREEFERSNSVIARMDRAIQAIDGGSLQNMLGTVKQIARSFGALGAFGIAGAIAAITKGGIELNQEYQRQLTTMASILAMTTRVVDSQGHQVSRQQALNFQLAEAGKLYTLIRREAASTILTGRELFGAVSANLGLGASAGLTPQQTVEMSKQITQLAKASGLQGERQFAQETRALLTGQGLQSGTVARILGIFSKKQVEEHIQKGDLFTYIMDRVNKAEPFLKRFKTSFDGVMTTLTTKAQDLNRLAFEKFFEKLTSRIGDLNRVLTQERLEMWAEKISDGLIKVFDAIDSFVSGGGFQKLMGFFNLLMTNGTTLIQIFAAMRGALALGGAAGSLRDFQRSETSRLAQAAQLAGQTGGVSGTGAALAGGAAGAGRLGTLAGGIGNALSVAGAGLAGVGIGTALDQLGYHLSGEAEAAQKEEESRKNLDRMRTGRAAQGLRLAEAKQRIRESQREFVAATGTEDQDRIAVARRQVEAAVYVEHQVEKAIADERKKAADADLHLKSLAEEENERKRREAANKERVKAGLELAKLQDDKVHQINAQAQLDAIEAKEKISNQETLRKVLTAIEKKRLDDVADYRQQRLIDFKTDLAKQTGLQKDAIQADYAATIKGIEDKHYADDQEEKLKLAARQAGMRKLRDLQVEQIISERELLAESTGNVLMQLDIQFARKAMEVRKEVETTKTGRAAEGEIERRYHLLRVQLNRERMDKIIENEDRARDLARRSVQTERDRADAIKRFTREVSDLQKRTARELRDLAREQLDAQRDLLRARRAGQFDERRMGRAAPTGPGGGFLPGRILPGRQFLLGTPGIEGTNFALQDEASGLLGQFGIDEQVRRAMTARNGATLGGPMATRQLRQLREQFATGDVEGGLGQLQELGIRPGAQFGQAARELGAKALGNQEEAAKLADDQAREQLKQQREDAGKQIEDAQRRIQELDERQAELTKDYKETIINLHRDFNDAILKNADDMKSLSHEVTRFVETLKASGIAIRNDFMSTLRKVAGGPTTQVGAEAIAERQGQNVINMIFGAESIKLDASGTAALRTLADAIDQQARRTAPPRK